MEGAIAHGFAELPEPIGIGTQERIQDRQRMGNEAAEYCPIALLYVHRKIPNLLPSLYLAEELGSIVAQCGVQFETLSHFWARVLSRHLFNCCIVSIVLPPASSEGIALPIQNESIKP